MSVSKSCEHFTFSKTHQIQIRVEEFNLFIRIMFRHILPNVIGPLIVAETLAIPGYISLEAFLSFIGLGDNPPTPSWGNMISDGQQVLRTYPHQAIFPALTLAITMFAFNFLGDGLRDALDPRLRGTQ